MGTFLPNAYSKPLRQLAPLHWGALPATMTLVHKTIIMWDEIMDMPGEIFDFDAWIEEVASDPEFIAEVDKNNAQFDLEVSQLSV